MLRKNNGIIDLVRLGKRFEQVELFIHSQDANDVKRKTFHKQGFIQKRCHTQIFTPELCHAFVQLSFHMSITKKWWNLLVPVTALAHQVTSEKIDRC